MTFHLADREVWFVVGTGPIAEQARKVWRDLAPGQEYIDGAWTHRGFSKDGFALQRASTSLNPRSSKPESGVLVELAPGFWLSILVRGTGFEDEALSYLDYVNLRALSAYLKTRAP